MPVHVADGGGVAKVWSSLAVGRKIRPRCISTTATNKQANKQTNKQTRKQASKQASKQAKKMPKNLSPEY